MFIVLDVGCKLLYIGMSNKLIKINTQCDAEIYGKHNHLTD